MQDSRIDYVFFLLFRTRKKDHHHLHKLVWNFRKYEIYDANAYSCQLFLRFKKKIRSTLLAQHATGFCVQMKKKRTIKKWWTKACASIVYSHDPWIGFGQHHHHHFPNEMRMITVDDEQKKISLIKTKERKTTQLVVIVWCLMAKRYMECIFQMMMT